MTHTRTRTAGATHKIKWHRRRATAFVAVFGVASALTATLPQLASPAAAGALANPASLVAPAAPAPVVMGCQTGQVDLNHASPASLQTLPTPDGSLLSPPAAGQIVAGRPYLQPTDLKAPADLHLQWTSPR